MTAPMCMWEQCDRTARVGVAVRKRTCGTLAHGAFCVPHSALTSRVLRRKSGAEVWFDWLRTDHDLDCGCDPIDWSLFVGEDGVPSALGGEPRMRGLEPPDEVDPLEWAR